MGFHFFFSLEEASQGWFLFLLLFCFFGVFLFLFCFWYSLNECVSTDGDWKKTSGQVREPFVHIRTAATDALETVQHLQTETAKSGILYMRDMEAARK